MLIRHSVAYLVARGLPGLLNFAALLIYTRLLSPEDYGAYTLVIAGVSMVGVIVFQWQRLVLGRWLPATKDDPERFLGNALCVFLALALAAMATGTLAALWWPDPAWQRLVALAVPLLIALNWLELNLVAASAQLAPGRYGRILGAKSTIALAVGAILAWLGLGPYAPLLGLLSGCALAVPLFGLALWRGVKPTLPERTALREQLQYGLPLIVTFALGWIIASSDRLLIGWLLNLEAAGRYSVGYDLAQYSLGLLLAIVQLAAYPLAVRAMEDHGQAAATAQMGRNAELIMGLALASAGGLSVLAPQIATVIVGEAFRDSTSSVLPWVALGAALGGIKSFHWDTAFHLGRASRGLVTSGTVAAVSNLGLNLLLIPRFGILGAAYATVLAYLLGAATSAWLGKKVFSMPPSAPLILRTGGVAVAAAAGAKIGAILGPGIDGLIAGVASGMLLACIAAWIIDLAGMRSAAYLRFARRGHTSTR